MIKIKKKCEIKMERIIMRYKCQIYNATKIYHVTYAIS